METTTENQITKVLYFEDREAIARTTKAAEAAANALSEVYKHYKFKELTEIPSDVQEFSIRRTLETNPALAALAKVHKLETLKYEIPQWIKDAAQSFSHWHSVKNGFTQVLQFVKQIDDVFTVDYQQLENLFEGSETYRKYLSGPQLERLAFARRWVELLKDSGFQFSKDFQVSSQIYNLPFVSVIDNEFVPRADFVLLGKRLPSHVPMLTSSNSLSRNYLIIK